MENIFKFFKKDNNNSNSSFNIGNRYTYSWKMIIEALKIAINYEKNPILLSFFKDYEKAIHEIDNLDAKDDITLMKEYEDDLRNELQVILDKEAELRSFGINVSKTSGFSKKVNVYVDASKDDKIASYMSPFYLFNDVGLSLRDLNADKLVGYEMELERLNKNIAEYDVVALNSRLEKLTNYEKTFPFINNMYAAEIEDIKKKLEDVKKLSLEKKEIEKKIKAFSKLTATEKEKIKELLLCVKKFGKEKNGYDNLLTFNNLSTIYGYGTKKNDGKRRVYSRAIKYMLDSGEITPSRIELLIDEIKNTCFRITDEGYPNNLFDSEMEKKKCLNIYPEYNRLVIELLKFLYPDNDLDKGSVSFMREEKIEKKR